MSDQNKNLDAKNLDAKNLDAKTIDAKTIDIDKWLKAWKAHGAYTLSKHDPHKDGIAVSAFLPLTALLGAAKELYQNKFLLLDLSALEAQEGYVVTYHFDHLESSFRLAFRALVSRKKPSLPSIHPIFPGAEWHEREAYDFFGLTFDQNPNLIPLLLPDDFAGPPPLRKTTAALAPIAKLGLLGQVEILDADFGALIGQTGGLSS
ncbi:MAG: NADH-quinone oxidoreductase subunit C [Deltaproteobacteria bacterium]|jgi:NADH-quinone oxidoreductase subunit C|nr:NADH-quinone oxidoreductase subunit C [Deltaproteobacteria bacterium]